MNSLKNFPFHPFLFCIFPILHLYSNNSIESQLADIFFPILFSTSLVIVFLLLSKIFLKDLKKSPLIISILICMIFFYGYIYEILNFNEFFEIELKHRILLPLFSIIFIIFSVIIAKKVNSQNTNVIFNVVSITLIITLIPNLIFLDYTNFDIENNNIENESYIINQNFYTLENPNILESENKPNIFFIILDGYGGTKRMIEDLKYDNYPFLDELKSREFIVSDNSNSNYPSSKWTMTSVFNMIYLPSITQNQTDNQHSQLLSFMKQNNEVMRNLKTLNYEIIIFQPDGFFNNNYPLTDQTYCNIEHNVPTKFEQSLLRTTILNFIITSIEVENDRTSILCGFNEAPKFLDDTNSPIFLYLHLRLPHPPYVFGANGEFVIPGEMQSEAGSFKNEKAYIDSIKFANTKVISLIDEILSKDKNSIIIIQSDHGYDFDIDYENPSSLSLKQRLSNINAVYYPFGNQVFYDGFTSVNTFRIIFNDLFNAEYEILEDRMFYHPYGTSYVYKQPKFIDVTSKILN